MRKKNNRFKYPSNHLIFAELIGFKLSQQYEIRELPKKFKDLFRIKVKQLESPSLTTSRLTYKSRPPVVVLRRSPENRGNTNHAEYPHRSA